MNINFSEQNRNAIKKYHHSIIELIGKKPSRLSSEPQIEKAGDGSLTLSALTRENKRIYLHSRYNPVEEAKKISAGWRIKKTDSTIIMLGFGLGYLPLNLIQRLASDQSLFIVEPSIEIFRLGLEHMDLLPLLNRPRTHFMVGPSFLNDLKKYDIGNDYKIFFALHPPSLRLSPELRQAVSFLEKHSFHKLREALDYPKFTSPRPKILLFEAGFYIEQEFKSNLDQLDISCRSIPVKTGDGQGETVFIHRIMEILIEFKPDFILTINQMGFDQEGKLAEMLNHFEIPFVCWFVDNPLPILSRSGKNACEYGVYFLWDDFYSEQMKKLGFEKVEYLPYAADSSLFYPALNPVHKKYNLSFVGSSMTYIINRRLEEIKGEPLLMDIYHNISKNRPSSHFEGETRELIKMEIGEKEYSDSFLSSIEVAINSKWTQDQRVRMLLVLKDFRPHIFGDEGWKRLLPDCFHFHPPVDYRKELPDIYRSTEINLNISNIQLKNSVNQRLFDVCACGSLLLSDRRTAVEQFLLSGKETETFETEEELRKKAEYYLDHAEEREHIEKKGCATILNNHTYLHRIEDILRVTKKYF